MTKRDVGLWHIATCGPETVVGRFRGKADLVSRAAAETWCRMTDLKMTLACWNYDRTRALMDGSVKPEGIDLTLSQLVSGGDLPPHDGQARVRSLRARPDLLSRHAASRTIRRSSPFRSIRSGCSRHSAIYINTNKGIAQPKDLIGKKIGEFFLYGHDAGTWSKGILQDHYGVPVDSYSNYIGGVERRRRRCPGTSRSRRRTSRCSTSAPRRRSMRCSMRARSTRCSPRSCRRR